MLLKLCLIFETIVFNWIALTCSYPDQGKWTFNVSQVCYALMVSSLKSLPVNQCSDSKSIEKMSLFSSSQRFVSKLKPFHQKFVSFDP